jgi:hypothetical protein
MRSGESSRVLLLSIRMYNLARLWARDNGTCSVWLVVYVCIHTA